VSGFEFDGLAATAAMESMSGSVVDGEAKAPEGRSALTTEQMPARSGKRGSCAKRPANVAANQGLALPKAAARLAVLFLSEPAAMAKLPIQPATHSRNAANASDPPFAKDMPFPATPNACLMVLPSP
jgi:hypothetical protein